MHARRTHSTFLFPCLSHINPQLPLPCCATAHYIQINDQPQKVTVLVTIHHCAQHFLYFLPLPHGQASLRPGRLSTTTGRGGFSRRSSSLISSAASGSTSMVHTQPCSSQTALISASRSGLATLSCTGFFPVPSFASLRPSKILPAFSVLTRGFFRGLNTRFPIYNPFVTTARLPAAAHLQLLCR